MDKVALNTEPADKEAIERVDDVPQLDPSVLAPQHYPLEEILRVFDVNCGVILISLYSRLFIRSMHYRNNMPPKSRRGSL